MSEVACKRRGKMIHWLPREVAKNCMLPYLGWPDPCGHDGLSRAEFRDKDDGHYWAGDSIVGPLKEH